MNGLWTIARKEMSERLIIKLLKLTSLLKTPPPRFPAHVQHSRRPLSTFFFFFFLMDGITNRETGPNLLLIGEKRQK